MKTKEEKKAYHAAWYQANKEKQRADMTIYYQANKEKCKAEMAAWYTSNKDEIKVKDAVYYQENKDKKKAQSTAWQKNNRGKRNAIGMKYYAAKLQATPPWLTPEHYKQIEELYTLAEELQWLAEDKLVVDHIEPLQGKISCGLHVPWNLQIIGNSANCSKGNKL